MNKRAILAATAMLVTSFQPVVITPAFADVVVDPQQFCEDQLKPNDPNSEFQTDPVDVVAGDWTDDGAPVRDEDVGDPVPTGTPVASSVIVDGSYFRNGGSPNVWAMAHATLTYPNSTQEYTTLQHQTLTTTFGCHVWKYVGPDDHNLVEPPGLQTTGNSVTDERDIAGPNGFDTNAGPITIYDQLVHALICISPNNVTKGKPGTWTGKNGFLAANCPAASIAAGGTVPSDNAPNI
jgi:hypothetical protein